MTGKYVHNHHLRNTYMKKITENTKITLTLKQLKNLVKEGKSWPKDIEYDDEEIDVVDEPKKSDKDEEQKAPATDRAEEIREKIKEIEKERDFWMQRDDEEYKRYQSFEDRAGWTTRAKANKIRDDFFERMDSFRSFINDCNKRLETLNKELKNLVKEGIDDEDDEGPADVDTAVKDLFDMYRACKVEPKVCNAIKADGEKTNIFLGRGNSVGGIAKALRDGRLLKVIGFN